MTLKICRSLFYLLIVSLPLVRPLEIFVYGHHVPPTDFIFLAVLFFWLVALVRSETRFEYSKFYIFLGFYALAFTISTILSTQPEKSIYKLAGEFYLLCLAVLTFNLVRDTDVFRRVTYAWLAGTGLTILASIGGFVLFYLGFKTETDNYFLSHLGSLPPGNYPRIQALFDNPNMLTNFLNVSVILTVLAEENGWLRKVWARVMQAGIWFAALFALSAGLGGMLLSLGIWFWVVFRDSKRQLSKLALAAGLSCALLIFLSTLVSPDTGNTRHDFSTPFSEKIFEPSVRVLVWENALRRFSEFPIAGRGTGTNVAEFQYRPLSGENQLLLDAHNVWLNVLGQTGLIGIAAFFALVLYLATRCRFDFDDLNQRNLIHLALGCSFVGAFLYQGLSGSFEDARHLWIVFGMLVAFSTSSSRTDASEASEEL
jgi:hypothetical protein